MKKNIIALAVASAIAAPVAMADAPTVYGKINQAIQFSKETKSNSSTTTFKGSALKSYASRLGVKGSEDLGNGLKAVYGVEFGLGMVDGSGISNRNQFAGLSGSFGTVIIGRHDTPFKMAQGYDAFNDKEFDNNWSGLGAFGSSGEDRVNNALAYVSPDFGGVKILAAVVPSETTTAGDTSGMADGISAAVMYGSKKKGLFLSAAYNSFNDKLVDTLKSTTNKKSDNQTRIFAQYSVAGLTAAAYYADFSGDAAKLLGKDGTDMTVDLAYKMGNLTPRVKYSMIDYKAAGTKDGSGMGVGVDYALSKKVKTYVDYMDMSAINGTDGKKTTVFQVGMDMKF